MKNSNDNTFDPGLLLSGEELKSKDLTHESPQQDAQFHPNTKDFDFGNLFDNDKRENQIKILDAHSDASEDRVKAPRDSSIDESPELEQPEIIQRQLNSHNPLFDTRKFVGTNRSFRSNRKGVQTHLNLSNEMVSLLSTCEIRIAKGIGSLRLERIGRAESHSGAGH